MSNARYSPLARPSLNIEAVALLVAPRIRLDGTIFASLYGLDPLKRAVVRCLGLFARQLVLGDELSCACCKQAFASTLLWEYPSLLRRHLSIASPLLYYHAASSKLSGKIWSSSSMGSIGHAGVRSMHVSSPGWARGAVWSLKG